MPPKIKAPIKRKPGRPKKKHAGGRPSVMTKETVDKLMKLISVGLNDSDAADQCGIDSSTITKWKSKPAFFKKYREAKSKLKTNAKITIAKNIGDLKTAQWYLEKYDDECNKKAENEINIVNQVPDVTVKFVSRETQKDDD